MLVTVSFGAVLLVIIPAFSPFIRAFYSAAFNHLITKLITSTGFYKLWLKSGLRSKEVRDHGREHVSKMKQNVKDALARQSRRKAEIRDGVRDANGNRLSTVEKGPPRRVAGAEGGVARETRNGVAMADLRGKQNSAGSWA